MSGKHILTNWGGGPEAVFVMQPRYDFTLFYQNEKLSDVIVLIRIDGDVKQRLPGHGIVLANGELCWGC